MKDEYEVSYDDAEKLKSLTTEQATEYITRIRTYTTEIMRKVGKIN